jgi:hypothetical protein
MLLIVHREIILKDIIKSSKLDYALVLLPLKLSGMSDCKFYVMRELQMFPKVMYILPLHHKGS